MKLQTQRGELRVYVVRAPYYEGDTQVDGLYDDLKYTITIAQSPDENFMKMKLLHELLHVCFSPLSGDARQSVFGGKLYDEVHRREEKVVGFLEPTLYDLLCRNLLIRIPKPPRLD